MNKTSMAEHIWYRLRTLEHKPLPNELRRLSVKLLLSGPKAVDRYKMVGSRETLFVHVPKTGGTSIARMLGLPYGHVPVSRFLVADRERFMTSYSFAFVRNPWDRLYSAFNYLHSSIGLNSSREVRWAEDNLKSFEDFESFVLALKDQSIRRRILQWPHFRDQSTWLCMPGTTKVCTSFVGRYENLKKDTDVLLAELGLTAELPHYRKAERYGHKTFTPEMTSIVGDLYKRDITIFDYTEPC